jgi:hypothetical protein
MSFNNIKGNSTVMTDEDNVLVNPTDEEIVNANPAFKSLKDKTQNITATENDTTFAGNIVVGDAINAGDNNITALKGWYIQYMDISGINSDTLVFYIGINQLTFEEGKAATEPSIDSTIESGYVVGDTISFVDDFHALNCAVITDIDHNKITVGSLGAMIKRKLAQASANNGWVDDGGNAQNDYSLCVFAKPTINEGVIINDNGYAFGRNNLALGGESMAHGSKNISMGEYSTTQGVGLTSEGYAQTVVGGFNTIEPDTDNQYGSKNVFVVGNGENLSKKSTAFTVKWSGDATIKNNFQAGGEVSSASMTTNTLSLNGQDVGDKLTSLQGSIDTLNSDTEALQTSVGTLNTSVNTLNNKTQKITSDGTSTTISGNLDISNGDIVADSVVSAGEISGSNGVFSGDVSVGGTSVKKEFNNISLEKQERGRLYCEARSFAKGDFERSDILSVIFKTDITFQMNSQIKFFSVGEYSSQGFSLNLSEDNVFRLLRNNSGFVSYSYNDVVSKATENTNIFCAVFKKETDGNASGNLYVNGTRITPTNTKQGEFPLSPENVAYLNGIVGTISGTTSVAINYQDVMVFNFDVFADGAPYSYADYANGKLVPPALKNTTATNRALLILENYTIMNGSSKFIPDVSGNNRDFTVQQTSANATIKGDLDVQIAKLKEYLTANS